MKKTAIRQDKEMMSFVLRKEYLTPGLPLSEL